MTIKAAALFIFLTATLSIQVNAQNGSMDPDLPSSDLMTGIKKNIFKINLTGIVVKNYSAQYERVISKRISVALAYRNMPESSLPFKKVFEDNVDDNDQDAKDAINSVRLSNYAITPEMRFYIGKKGYGRGFYIAPFYRYASFKANNITFEVDDNPFIQNSIALAGKLTSNTGGLMFGAQWELGKNIMLDWWILGAHYGAADGNFSGIAARPLTPAEQAELRSQLEDLDIPFADKTISVNAAGATMKLDGPWAGLRGGICLGIRF